MQNILIQAFLVTLLSCSSNSTKTEKPSSVDTSDKATFSVKPLLIDNGEEEGWGADIKLSITEIVPSDSFTTYRAVSSYKGKNIGLNLTLPNEGPKNENALAQILIIKSSGDISDNLLATLSELYKLKVDTTKQFISSIRTAFIDLNEFAKSKFGGGVANKSEAKEMKLFFEAENPDDNAELYLNINDKEHWIEIKEKDEGYREQVIKFWTKK